MTRPEKRRRIKQYTKELEYIYKHTPYNSFKNTSEFMLPKDELDLLVANTHENKVLQDRFNLAKDLFARVDALTTWTRKLKEATKAEHPEGSGENNPHLNTLPS